MRVNMGAYTTPKMRWLW